jgi:hypothetical protein
MTSVYDRNAASNAFSHAMHVPQAFFAMADRFYDAFCHCHAMCVPMSPRGCVSRAYEADAMKVFVRLYARAVPDEHRCR